MLKAINGNESHELHARKIKVYDVEKKELIGEFDSMNKAALFVGCSWQSIRNAANSKTRIYKNKLGKILCVR